MGTLMLLWMAWWGTGLVEPPEIEFVFRNGFSGAFVVVEDSKAVQPQWIDRAARIQVPASRIVRVKSFEPFRRLAEYKARYEDDSVIPLDGQSGVTADTRALRPLGMVSSEDGTVIEFWVGEDISSKRDQPEIDSPFRALRERAAEEGFLKNARGSTDPP